MSEDRASPFEELMLSSTIGALEEHDVGIIDIPGAFMKANMVGNVHMKMEGG